MMRLARSSGVRLALFAAAFAGVLPLACQDALVAERCANIPAGGCPKSKANVCSDPACEAVYACTPDRTWSLEYACPPRDDGGAEASPIADGTAPPRDVRIDAPPGAYGGPGCEELQLPDCSLGAALECPPGNCCGCEDVFVCESGGWKWWGACERGSLSPGDR
jgi:hypothetical protein